MLWKRVLGVLILAAAVLYLADYAYARFGLAPGGTYGSVRVTRTLAVEQKNSKNEYFFPPAEDETCVNALFPHFGVSPCWYLKRHQAQTVQM